MVLGDRIRASSPMARILFVALFAFLLVFGTTVGLMHFHPDGSGHADCALCQNAHNVIRPSSAPAVRPIFLVVQRVAPPDNAAIPRTPLLLFALEQTSS